MTELDIVASVAGWGDGVYAPTLLEDALRVLESDLSSREVNILWCAAMQRAYRPDFFGVDARVWLGRIVEVCAERIRQDDSSFTLSPTVPAPAGNLTGEVLEELRSVAPAVRSVAEGHEHYGVPDVVRTVEKVVVHVDPDLGFRMLLRVLKAYQIPVEASRVERYRVLGERFGYDECVVDDGGINLGPDPA
ncbi:hypothetical protein ACFWTC_16090 [Streptomyces sp. NPDC058619]|uniref:hypothetical protein n=1 Tax=unclassified Streptomyces TaxID=2593676 RepID=UPI003660A6EC